MVRNNGGPFVRTAIETPSVAAMRVDNPDRSPIGINRWDAAPTPAGFAEIVTQANKRFRRSRSVSQEISDSTLRDHKPYNKHAAA